MLTPKTPKKKFRSLRHNVRIIVRNAVVAFFFRILFGIIKGLMRKGVSRAFLTAVEREIFSLNPPKWAVVVAGFSSFRLISEVLETFSSRVTRLPKKLIPFASGCICSLPALVMNGETRTELALYALVRALHTFHLRFIFPLLPKFFKEFQHYDVLLMCMSSSQICYGTLYAQSTFPPGYLSFLMRASMHDDRFIRGCASFMRRHVTPELVEFSLEKKWPVLLRERTALSQNQLCNYAHEGFSCNTWALYFIWKSVLTMGIPLYAPLTVMKIIVFGRKKLLANPLLTVAKSIRSILTSSLFLGLYIACFTRSACYCLQHGSQGGKLAALLSFFAGMSTLLEPKSRRIDLSFYCLTFSLRSFILTQNRLGRLPYPKQWFLLLIYLVSMGYMFFEYEEEPDLLNSRVRDAFQKLLGERRKKDSRAPSPIHASGASTIEVVTSSSQK